MTNSSHSGPSHPEPSHPSTSTDAPLLGRRHIIGAGSLLAMGLLMGDRPVYAEEFVGPKPTDGANVTPVGCAVIGLGVHGRDILTALSHTPGADVKMVCDNYERAHNRALEIFPNAKAVIDAKEVFDDKSVQAVWIATPPHHHKDLVIAALQAGKHVYCEAPLAHTIDDAREIAKAAIGAKGQIFHSGLQQRTNPQHLHVEKFIRTGALGKITQGRGHWHRRTSWKRGAATDERQKALNWRLQPDITPGLMGEVGIHQIDVATWFLKKLPTKVTGFGGVLGWTDGREVHDTVQCVVSYPGNRNFVYDATLTNSFNANSELFQGTDAAVLLRDHRAWMFKEADSAALGWEVYAYREKIGDDTGIALVADATKILAQGKQPGENRDVDPTRTALVTAAEAFLYAIRTKTESACDALTGFQATVIALKAHEATVNGTAITFDPAWFEI